MNGESVKSSFWLQLGSLLLFLAVAAGAFGAHGLQDVFSAKQLDVWHKAVNYQVIHAFALLAVAVFLPVFPQGTSLWRKAGWSFLIGVLLFSGSLYLWALTGVKFLVFLTPIGGTAFLIGWLFVFLGARKLTLS
ncbi:DUF423 domain-containing protein [Thiomicrorhabdus sp. HH1]|uniref:DUF423 domain-containing protein n=1 Tax=Thiomicrorhabdus heinhorstiae TaxID=2748010 RepID=A0ABS0BT86_9GAMM|nr:DUF423 domain-containing protein [Thiomicrorhabdus heinhorstiae]